jgi:hypothetical protein
MGDEILRFEQLLAVYKVKKPSLEDVRKWFPLCSSPKLASLVAALISDGHIDCNTYDGNPRPKKLILYSNNPKECRWFLDTVFDLFQVHGSLVKYRPKTGFSIKDSYKAVIYCAELARVFILLGVPAGDKTQCPFIVPGWITNSSPDTKKAFLSALFNFDGSISLRTRRESSIEMNYSMNKHYALISNAELFLNQIKELLAEFEITCGKIHVRRCDGDKFTLILFITNQLSILNFHTKIGFLNDEKVQRLEAAVARINKYRRVDGGYAFLRELKEKLGTDRAAVAKINELSEVKYTYRQFEHMRRGESLIPVDMLNAATKILNRKTTSRN